MTHGVDEDQMWEAFAQQAKVDEAALFQTMVFFELLADLWLLPSSNASQAGLANDPLPCHLRATTPAWHVCVGALEDVVLNEQGRRYRRLKSARQDSQCHHSATPYGFRHGYSEGRLQAIFSRLHP